MEGSSRPPIREDGFLQIVAERFRMEDGQYLREYFSVHSMWTNGIRELSEHERAAGARSFFPLRQHESTYQPQLKSFY
jgi:hypothetical protein